MDLKDIQNKSREFAKSMEAHNLHAHIVVGEATDEFRPGMSKTSRVILAGADPVFLAEVPDNQDAASKDEKK